MCFISVLAGDQMRELVEDISQLAEYSIGTVIVFAKFRREARFSNRRMKINETTFRKVNWAVMRIIGMFAV